MIIQADSLAPFPLPDASVQCCVTSPPYWGLRDYGVDGQLGLEATPEEFVERLVGVFREVWRVLRDDGSLWMNLGDSYWNGGAEKHDGGHGFVDGGKKKLETARGDLLQRRSSTLLGLKPKDLVGIPWRVAFALQADGWYLRSDIIWSKPNPMPESVTDRPTKAHEYLFLLSKAQRYYYDADAVREPQESLGKGMRFRNSAKYIDQPTGVNNSDHHGDIGAAEGYNPLGRNRRTVWSIPTQPTPEAHFAAFPEALVEPCIMAGTSDKGCCPECGVPWERVVEKELVPTKKAAKMFVVDERDLQADKNDQGSNRQKDGHKPGWIYSTKTIGWRSACQCSDELYPIPCVVLDPFGGTGTTVKVAQRLGRKGVALEINSEYCRMAHDKTWQTSRQKQLL